MDRPRPGSQRTTQDADYRSLVERIPAIVYVSEAGGDGRWHYVSPRCEAILGYSAECWRADPGLWARLLHPDDRERILAEEAAALEGVGDAPPAEYRMCACDGRTVWIRDDAALVLGEDGQLQWHGVLSDITDRKLAEAELQQRLAQQAAVARLGALALEGQSVADLMQTAVSQATLMLDLHLGAVLERMPDEGSLTLRAGFGWPSQAIDNTRAPAGELSQAGFTLQTGQAVMVTDWSKEQRFHKPAPLVEHDMHSGMTVLIKGREAPWGVLAVHCRRPRHFTDADIDFVQAVANVLADAIQRRASEDDIRHQALHDPLTGLPNRVLFRDRLQHALARRHAHVAVLFVDIDHFKLVNDSLGHALGDELLREIAPRLHEAVRPGDTIARFGGDEFAILLEDVDSESAAAGVAQRIAAAFTRPFILGASEHFATASVGIATPGAGERDSELPDTLIRDADAAMYRAKGRGRARYELFDETTRMRTIERLTVENELRRALERGQMRIAYQPVISLRDGSISGVEALLRWEHPDRGLIPPDQFVPIAEETGLIEPIGQWVLEQACAQAGRWQGLQPDRAPLGIAVNLSARQVTQPGLASIVARAVRRAGIQPLSLSLEITETVLLDETGPVLDTLRALEDLGVHVVLDDFGKGYSSLNYLTRLPIDRLKVDRSFVEGLGIQPRDSAIVTAVIGMARALSIGVTAEGVETERQLGELQRLGCDSAQGYLLASPLPAAEISALLGTSPPWAQIISATAGPASPVPSI